jgi:putative transposase
MELLLGIWTRSAEIDGWFVGRYVLMPDHVHLFARSSPTAKPLPTWIKTWKSISARRLMAEGKAKSPVWQADYFDHFVRSTEAYESKWEYVRQNPVRKGLCLAPDEWPYRGILHNLRFR